VTNINTHITKLISVLHRHIQSHYQKEFNKIGIGVNRGQFLFILYICDNEGASQYEISKEFRMNKSTVTRVISQLEKDGFVLKEINKTDKRIYNIFPTEKAKEVYPKILKVLDNWQIIISNGLSLEEKEQVINIMTKIKNNIILYEKREGEN